VIVSKIAGVVILLMQLCVRRDPIVFIFDLDRTTSGSAPEPAPAKPAKKAAPKAETKQGVKRKAAAPKKQQKQQKAASSDEESEAVLSELSDADASPKKPNRRGTKVVAEDSENEDSEDEPAPKAKKQSNVVSDESEDDVPKPARRQQAPKDDVSESEMSELIDESPAKKKHQKKEPAAKTKKEPAKLQAKAAKEEDSPDQAEIKRLQGWLVKCGICKVWSKELAGCDTAKEKIKHLRAMLSDAGMDGKYSIENAAKIKEKRKFEKDLEAIKEGEQSWGKTTETASGRPSRRAAARAAPVQKLVFSDDEEDEAEDNDQDDSGDDDQDDDDDESQDNEGEDSAVSDSE
jgi:hypothetical protein